MFIEGLNRGLSLMTRILSHQFDAAVGWVERDITENST